MDLKHDHEEILEDSAAHMENAVAELYATMISVAGKTKSDMDKAEIKLLHEACTKIAVAIMHSVVYMLVTYGIIEKKKEDKE
jgi:hypothetical protein